ncbi:tripartite tricarboxylate transporter TctB family protein [Paracoccus lutimaris]|uniref:Tripartite tricarboxylate transporter TctB family protein n=1 Tax=Paracoccus lutimaris TaxID=1490030 RepID=A0A368YS39_9RHOB|nr:tripartite tricarboxylate transporter TctB family protein [Paracoccus lutimaris]RCW82409.1 tripartite tricarboxylate transporter TctB family protein [Paracoccus lutimaris]
MSQPHLNRPRRARDIGLGAVSILIGAALLLGSRGFGAIPGQNYGADTLPRLIALLAIGTGIAMLIQVLRAPAAPPGDSGPSTGWIHEPRAWGRLGIGLALVLGYALFSETTGFVIAGFGVVAGLALLMGVRVLPAIALGIVSAIALRYAFADILLVPLPRLSLPGTGG